MDVVLAAAVSGICGIVGTILAQRLIAASRGEYSSRAARAARRERLRTAYMTIIQNMQPILDAIGSDMARRPIGKTTTKSDLTRFTQAVEHYVEKSKHAVHVVWLDCDVPDIRASLGRIIMLFVPCIMGRSMLSDLPDHPMDEAAKGELRELIDIERHDKELLDEHLKLVHLMNLHLKRLE